MFCNVIQQFEPSKNISKHDSMVILNVTYQIGNCHQVLEEICSSHGLPICQHASISQEGDTSFSKRVLIMQHNVKYYLKIPLSGN